MVQHNIHYRRPRWGSLTQQHAYLLRKAHFQQFETHLSQTKKLLWKIPITFPFDWGHFYNVSAEALFHGMHSGKTRESPQVYSVTKMWNLLDSKAMCKDISCITYNNLTNWRHVNLFSCRSFSFPLLTFAMATYS